MEDYRTIRGTAVGEYEEKKSRFIAQLSFADSEEAAVAFLEQVRAANRRRGAWDRLRRDFRWKGGRRTRKGRGPAWMCAREPKRSNT